MIRFDNVTKQYSGTTRPALDTVTLEILRGEFVFLVGASGSGKSSCLRLMLKEEKPSKGKIHVLGQDLGAISSRKVPYFRRNIGVVFQDFRLLPNKTVFDNVAFTLQVIGKSRGFIQEAVPDVINMVGLTGKAGRLPHELSGGEQQRVAIARAVVNKPQVLLADEPTGNLDPATSAGIMAVLERINAGGTTVIMATHEAGIVDQMQRRVIELVNGQVIRDERHGGYGFTAAVPVLRAPELDPTPVESAPVTPPPTTGIRTLPQPTRSVPAATPPAPASPAEAAAAAASTAVPGVRSAEAVPDSGVETTPVRSAAATSALSGLDELFGSAAAEGETESSEVNDPSQDAGERVPASVAEARSSQNAHFVSTATQSMSRPHPPTDPDLPEQLALAERLGLRGAGSDDELDSEQNVGPTR